MGDRCANCRKPDAEPRELLTRTDDSSRVYLCTECHTALEGEFVWPN
jgi:predicted SprT family Zn-dependent metalloprotease